MIDKDHRTFVTEKIDRKGVLDSTLRFIAQQGWLETGKSFLEFLGRTLEVEYVLVDGASPAGHQGPHDIPLC